MSARRVVVTGLGAVSPLGIGAKQIWANLVAGKSGIVALDEEAYASLPSRVAGRVPKDDWDPSQWVEKTAIKRTPLFVQYAMAAAKLALDDSRWPAEGIDRDRVGVVVGSSIGGLEAFNENAVNFHTSGYRKVSPLFIPNLLNNMAAGHISITHGFRGPNHSVSTACTTGAHAIGDAANFIRYGMADAVVAGSSEACVHPLAVAGFARARSLATKFNDEPAKASRPFDRDRNGFVIGEGAAVLILESLEHALNRGAPIYAEVAGYGASADANHITAPAEDGRGAFLSMQMALKTAGLDASDVGYINAHATSTPRGDAAENEAILRLFGPGKDSPNQINVSSTKSATGHLLGAAGSIEAMFTVMALHTQTLPPTLNLDNPDSEFTCNYVAHKSQPSPIKAALTNSFGFGGTNASLAFTRFE